MAVVACTQETAYKGADDDANVVGGGGKGRPGKFFERIEGREQHGEGSQSEKREEDDLRILQGELFFRTFVACDQKIDEVGGKQGIEYSGDEHDDQDKVDDGEDDTAEFVALLRCGVVIKGGDEGAADGAVDQEVVEGLGG